MRREPLLLTAPPPAIDDGTRTALESIYASLERDLTLLDPSCRACGSCCRLARWGHELRVTPLELALFGSIHGLRAPETPGVCPYLEDDRCQAREGRILGCRSFFCDLPAATMEDAHARAFEALGALHEERNIPFEQGDWLATLSIKPTMTSSSTCLAPGEGEGDQVGSRPATSE